MPADDKVIETLEKQVDELSKKLEAAIKDGGAEKIAEAQKAADEAKKALETQKAEMDALKAENELLKAKGKMTPAEQAACDAMAADDEKKKFIEMSPEDRQKRMAEIAKGDESITVDGQTVSKSKVGPEMFAVIKSQQARIQKGEEEVRKEREERQTVELTKRAETELENLPGEVAKKVDVLKTFASMPEEARATLETMLKAGNAAMKAAFQRVGQCGGDPEKMKSADSFLKHVSEIKKRDNCTDTQAQQTARKEHPEAFKTYQEVGAVSQ